MPKTVLGEIENERLRLLSDEATSAGRMGAPPAAAS